MVFRSAGYSWRHQLSAVADAGFHAVAPDQRGYGRTDRPEAVEAYHMFQLAGDIVGLVDAVGEKQPFIIGHDWGASVATYCALLQVGHLKRAIVLLSIPYRPRSWSDIRTTDAMKLRAGNQEFYRIIFPACGYGGGGIRSRRPEKHTSLFILILGRCAAWRSAGAPSTKRLRNCSIHSLNRKRCRNG